MAPAGVAAASSRATKSSSPSSAVRSGSSLRPALNAHGRAHRLSTRAGPQPGQRGYAAAGIETMLRTARTLASGQDLPTVGKAFRQLAAFGTASLQVVAAECAWSRAGARAGAGGRRMSRRSWLIRGLPAPGADSADQAGGRLDLPRCSSTCGLRADMIQA